MSHTPLTAQQLHDAGPLGALIRFSDGAVEPPARYSREHAAWRSANGTGRLVSKTPPKRASAASFTLHTGDFGKADVTVVKAYRVFAVISPLSFTILDKPRPGQVAVRQDEHEIPTLIHLADTEPDAGAWLKAHPHDNVRLLPAVTPEPRTFTYLQDPGHGWLIVRRDDLAGAGMSPVDFSACSYVNGDSLARITGAQRARDRTLDVAQSGVDPLEVAALGAAAAGDLDDVPEVGLGQAVEARQAIAQHTRSRRDAGLCIVPDRLLGEAGEDAHVGVDRPPVTGLDGDDERGLVGRSTPAFSGLFATLVGIVDLNVAGELVDRVALAHDLHQLLLDEPGGVPFDIELTGKLQRGDVVLGGGHQVHCQEPLGQRRARLVEDGPGPSRRLQATIRALEQPLRRAIAVRPAPTPRTHEAVRPAHPHEPGMALLLGAVQPLKLGHAQPLLELHLVACHHRLRRSATEAQDTRASWPNGGHVGVIRKAFPGVQDLFITLKRCSFALGIATSCKKDELVHYDTSMGILGLADAVACGDDAGKGKPHPDLYAVALRKLGMKDASTCMAVGDSPYNAMAARTAGLHAAGVLTGGFSRAELMREGCAPVLDRAVDLPGHLTTLK